MKKLTIVALAGSAILLFSSAGLAVASTSNFPTYMIIVQNDTPGTLLFLGGDEEKPVPGLPPQIKGGGGAITTIDAPPTNQGEWLIYGDSEGLEYCDSYFVADGNWLKYVDLGPHNLTCDMEQTSPVNYDLTISQQ